MTRVGTPGYKILRGEYAADDSHGRRDSAMEWLWAAVENLYHDGHELPPELRFTDSPAHADGGYSPLSESMADYMISQLMEEGAVTPQDVLTFAIVLQRYIEVLSHVPLYKTTVVIWSAYDGTKMELSSLADQAENGNAICTVFRSERVADPASDPQFTPDARDFFSEED